MASRPFPSVIQTPMLFGLVASALVACGDETPTVEGSNDPVMSPAGSGPNGSGGPAGADGPAGSDSDPAGTNDGPPVGSPSAIAAPGAGNPDDGLFVADGPPPAEDSSNLTDDTACSGVNLQTEPVEVEVENEIIIETEELIPVVMYIVLDNSLSMGSTSGGGAGAIGGGPIGGGAMDADGGAPMGGGAGGVSTKWNQAVEALTAFVTDQASEGLEVGLVYFNEPGSGTPGMGQGAGMGMGMSTDAGVPEPVGDPECDGSQHSTPEVPMGPLPDNATAIVDALQTAGPEGFTPTVGALNGGSQFCQDFMQNNPDKRCVVVMVTDGQPRGCGLDDCNNSCVDPDALGMLQPIAEEATAAGVKLFTVGMAGVTDDGFDLLDAIAAAGGTDCTPATPGDEACDVSETGAAGLLEALGSIRESVVLTETVIETMTVLESTTLPCTWSVPDPPEGESFDPGLVNIELSQGDETTTLLPVPTAADCGAEGGWYYDNIEAPTQILACEASCQIIESGEGAIDILFGCETIVGTAK